jgi:hypothetical protein
MQTFAQWRTQVKNAYQGGEPTHTALVQAVKDGARAVMVRDVESDLALAKSYSNSFRESKVRLAGTRMTDDIDAVLVEVKGMMPIDDDTQAAAALLENAITSAYDDINGAAEKWDAYLLQAAIDLQRHVAFYQVRQLTTFLAGGTGVVNQGFVSRVQLPATARIQQLWYGHYYPALEDGVAVVAGDIVISNGKAYTVITGGTPTVYEVATGLVSSDGENETLGTMVFTFYAAVPDFPVRKVDWNQRNAMFAGSVGSGAVYTMAPQSDELLLYPALDADHRFDLEWVGVTEDFSDTDDVLFDQPAAEAAAHYIRAMLYTTEMDDARNGAASLALYQRSMRKCVIDNQARDTGSPPSVAPYDWRRRCRAWGITTTA